MSWLCKLHVYSHSKLRTVKASNKACMIVNMQCQQTVDYVSLVYEISHSGHHVPLKGCPYIRDSNTLLSSLLFNSLAFSSYEALLPSMSSFHYIISLAYLATCCQHSPFTVGSLQLLSSQPFSNPLIFSLCLLVCYYCNSKAPLRPHSHGLWC